MKRIVRHIEIEKWIRKVQLILLLGATLSVTDQCIDPYDAKVSQTELGYLVVDAFLNGTDKTCTVNLSRTVVLNNWEQPPGEPGASVSLVDAAGKTYPLSETSTGKYVASNLPFVAPDKVKLKIKTKNSTDYESRQITLFNAPPIDSVTFRRERAGVSINVNARHGSNQSTYFHWNYSETWAYTAGFVTSYRLDSRLNLVLLTENIFQCWGVNPSNVIAVGSSSLLSNGTGVINEFPIIILPWESPKIQTRYSVLVEQRSIDRETYEYLAAVKKNTENLGTLFDPIPSHPAGNIICTNKADEIVLGNFTASTIHKKRIFFNIAQVKRPEGTRSVTGYEDCFTVEIRSRAEWEGRAPVWSGNGAPVGTTPFCVDCRLNGGTNKMPDYWVW
jgi:Domain of unknown function (DUF4249)